jgi:hypothetical protein
MKPKLTPEEKKTIREMYAKGAEIRKIKDAVPHATYKQIQYYASSASIYDRKTNAIFARLREATQ